MQRVAHAEAVPTWSKKNTSALDRATALKHSFSASTHSLQSSLWKLGEAAMRDVGAPPQIVRGAELKQNWHAQQAAAHLQRARDSGLTTNWSDVHDADTLASFLAHGMTQAIPPLVTGTAGALYASRLGATGALGAAAGTAAAWYLPAVGEVLMHQPPQDTDLRKAAIAGAGLTAAAVALPSVARQWTSSLSGVGVNGTFAQLLGWSSAGSAVAQTQTGLMHLATKGADADAGLVFKNQRQDSAGQGAVFGALMSTLDPTQPLRSLREPRVGQENAMTRTSVFPAERRLIETHKNSAGTWVAADAAGPSVQAPIDVPLVHSSSFGLYSPKEKVKGAVLGMPKPRMDEMLAHMEQHKSSYEVGPKEAGSPPSFAQGFLSLLQTAPSARRSRPPTSKSFSTDLKNLEKNYSRVASPMIEVAGLKAGGLDHYGTAKIILGNTADDLGSLDRIVDELRSLSRIKRTSINKIELVVPAGTVESNAFNEYLKSGADPKNILSSLKNGHGAGRGLDGLKVDTLVSNWDGQLIRIKLVPDVTVSPSVGYDPSQIGQGIVKTKAKGGSARYSREGVAITGRLDPLDRKFSFALDANSLQSFSLEKLNLIQEVLALEKNSVQKVDVQVPLRSFPEELIRYFQSDDPLFSMPGSATWLSKNLQDTAWSKALDEHFDLKQIKVRIAADPNQVIVSFLRRRN